MKNNHILFCVILLSALSIQSCFTGATDVKDDVLPHVLNRNIRSSDSELNNNKEARQVSTNNTAGKQHSAGHSIARFPVATVNWERVASPYIISLWIIVAGLTKIVFHLLHKVVSRVPESCILICLGLIVGGIAYSINKDHGIDRLLFNPDTFFLFILPPIVMEAGYFMPKEPFLENLGTILTYAIIGTIFNALAIGASLYGVFAIGLMPGIDAYGSLSILHCLLFGSIISAVDPVAVISVFEEIHVNTVLYICVFGESLLNDGVAVVLFKVFEEYIKIGSNNILPIDIAAAIASFFVVAFGGLFIGLLFGYGGSFITKYTVNNRIVEPTFVFVLCYLSYLTAEIFHLSGIIAIVFCAFTMSSYVEHNISTKSHTTVKYGMKMLANIAETIIFMLLGIAAVSDFWQYWNTGFVLWTLFFITIYRAIGVVTLTYMVNYVRLDKINKVDQFVMAYGGLRGAIAFSLVSLTSPDHVPAIKTMICACIVAILFTSFVQGSTIRPIVELLNVKTADTHRMSMFEDINLRLIDHLMAGIEDVTGHHGHHYWMLKLRELNTRYLAKWLTRDPYKSRNEALLQTFHKINKRDAEDLVLEIEKGNSYSDLIAGGTFANLLMPLELRRSYSQASFGNMIRQRGASEACIDMHAFEAVDKHKETSNIHYLLQANLYKPRTRETTRHRRGNIDEDADRRKQEREIFMRHRLSLQKRSKHHNLKHKHNKRRVRMPSKTLSPLASGPRSLKTSTTAPSFTHRGQQEESRQNMKPSTFSDDEGITFTVGAKPVASKNCWELGPNPLGFMSSFKTLREEESSAQLNHRRMTISGGGVYNSGSFSSQSSNDDLDDPNLLYPDSVALDRVLPWKRSTQSDTVVADPSNVDLSNVDVSNVGEASSLPSNTNSTQLWPNNSSTVTNEVETTKPEAVDDKSLAIPTFNVQLDWDNMHEDRV